MVWILKRCNNNFRNGKIILILYKIWIPNNKNVEHHFQNVEIQEKPCNEILSSIALIRNTFEVFVYKFLNNRIYQT